MALKLAHIEVMDEYGLQLTDLPKSIQDKMKGLKMAMGKADKSPEDTKLKDQAESRSVQMAHIIQDFIDEQEKKALEEAKRIEEEEAEKQRKVQEEVDAKAKAEAEAQKAAEEEAAKKVKEDEERKKLEEQEAAAAAAKKAEEEAQKAKKEEEKAKKAAEEEAAKKAKEAEENKKQQNPKPAPSADEEKVKQIIEKAGRPNRIFTADLTEILGQIPNHPEHKVGNITLRVVPFTGGRKYRVLR